MASYSYSALEVAVTANTKAAAAAIERDVTAAGAKAGAQASEHISKGMAMVGPAALAVGKAAVAGIGLATTAAVAFGVKSYKAAEEANKVTKQTAAVIKSTGGAANVTARQVQSYANALMAKTGADDEAIKTGENMLLTFRNVRNESGRGNDIFRQSTNVLADMTAALHGGSVTADGMKGSALQLGKALNDPVAGVGALTRVGVTFTDQQKAQITALTESGHRMQAQKMILAELRKEFGGSAVAGATFSEKIKTAWHEIQESVGGAVAKAIDPALSGIGRLASRFSAAIAPGGKLAPIFRAIGDAAGKVVAPFTKLIDLGAKWVNRLSPATVNKIAAAIERFGPALAGVGAAAAVVTGAGLFTQLPLIGPVIGHLIGPITSLIGKIGGLKGAMGFLTGPLGIVLTIFTTLMAVSPQFRNEMMQIGSILLRALLPAIFQIATMFKQLAPVIREVAGVLGKGLTIALEAIVPLVQVLGGVIQALAPVLPFLVKSFLAIFAAVKLWAAVQWVLDAALDANPIGLVAVAIAGLIVVLIAVWQHTTAFRKVVIGAFQSVFDWLKQNWPLLLGIITGPIGIATVLVIRNWGRIRSATVAAVNFIKNVVAAAWNWIKDTSANVWGAIRSAIASVLGAIWRNFTSVVSKVTSFWWNGLLTLVSDVKRLYSQFSTIGGELIRQFLSGISSAISGIGSWVKSHIVDPVVNAVKNFFGIHSPSAVMADLGSSVTEGFISGLVRQNPLDIAKSVFGGIPAALGHMVVKGLVGIAGLPGKAIKALGGLGSWFGNLLGDVGGFFGGLFGGGSPGVAHWSGLVSTVLGMLGLPGSYLGPWLAQMNTESGGNPNAINLTDSNAAAGYPSQGLLQTIPQTFAAYAGPFVGRGITDPLANIYAAINYALHRYGRLGMLGVIGHGHGYASGGIISEPVAGFGLRSRSLYSFGERGPEMVSPLTGPGASVPGAARAIVVNVYPQQGQSEVEIAAAVSRRLGWAEATGIA